MLKLPRLLSEGCVLQQGETRIWGWCDPDRHVTVRFAGRMEHARPDGDGRWGVLFLGLAAGGPFCMEITTDQGERIARSNVYVGEVWVACGQSNMELPIDRVRDQYEPELFDGENPFVRVFTVRESYEFRFPRDDYESGEWKPCTPEAIGEFSAFAYFFASELWQDRAVPVGIISSSLGGSRIEAWMGRDALKAYPEHLRAADLYRDEAYVRRQTADWETKQILWNRQLAEEEQRSERKESWKNVVLPGFLEEWGLLNFCGVVYLRKRFLVPDSMAGKPSRLWLSTLVDSDETYLNGALVGETGYQYPPRKYLVPAGLLKPGENEIQIRLVCRNGHGRVTPGKELCLFNGEGQVELAGTWQAMVGCRFKPAPEQDFLRRKPTGLYHAMLAPCQTYRVRGVVWYQGESNDKAADQYEGLLKRMIVSWREQWAQSRLPFVIVQLPNFSIDLPETNSGWPVIREAQSRAAELPDVAVTVNLDLGEDNDLHPVRKREAAHRAALAAKGMVYGEDVVWHGPILRLCQLELGEDGHGQKQRQIRLTFDTGDNGGLVTEDGQDPGELEVAGEDGVFCPAKGKISGNQVIISCRSVRDPAVIRYAWSNAPERGLLYNRSGLPAQPFQAVCQKEEARRVCSGGERQIGGGHG